MIAPVGWSDVSGRSWSANGAGILLPPKAKRSRPVGVDLFSGCGGFSLGMMQGGFDIVAACDFDAGATMTYLYNLGDYPCDLRFLSPEDEARFAKAVEEEYKRDGWIVEDGRVGGRKDGNLTAPNGRGPFVCGGNKDRVLPGRRGVGTFFFGDIRKLTGDMVLSAIGMDRGEVDIVFGGPPCQGFSTSGKRDILDPRNSLVFEFVRLVLDIQPKTICMENVPGILDMMTPEGLPVVEAVLMALSDGGFGTVDALRKMLATTSGVGVIMKKQSQAKPPKSDHHAPKDDLRAQERIEAGGTYPLVQGALFPNGEAA